MEPRLNLSAAPPVAASLEQFASASAALLDAALLPASLRNLVMLRASQINGCGWCTDVHSKDAAHAGEDPVRLALVAAWRESTVFSDAERAALELTEQGTRVADGAGGVSDAAWAAAAEHYGDEQLAALVMLIALINAANRIGVVNRMAGGGYRVGQFG